MKSIILFVALLLTAFASNSQTITVGFDVYFEQDVEVLGSSNDTYENGYPLNQSGYVYSVMNGPSSCLSWTSKDYWDTFGTYWHNETDYDCVSTSNYILSDSLPGLVIFDNWSYVTNVTVLARALSGFGQPTTIYYWLTLDTTRSAWIDWSGTPLTNPRISYDTPTIDFGKWAWDGSINPNYVEPLSQLKSNRGKHLGRSQAK